MKEQFSPGMHVRYGSSGVCLIDRVEDVMYPDGQERRCYILRPVRSSGMEITVSMESAGNLRPLLTKEEIDRMLAEAAATDDIVWNPERKLRNAEFRKILGGGDAQTLLRLIHCILKQRNALTAIGKHLSAADDNIRRDAERMLDEEFGFSLGLTAEEAGAYIRSHLNGSPTELDE